MFTLKLKNIEAVEIHWVEPKIIRIHDQDSVAKQIHNLSVEFLFYFLVQK